MRRGFSLIETMMATVIFLSAFTLIGGVWPAYARAAAKNAGYLAAVDVASQEMEISLAQGFSAVGNREGDVEIVNVVQDKTVRHQFHYIVTVTDISPELRSVQVQVQWTDLQGDQEIHFETILAS